LIRIFSSHLVLFTRVLAEEIKTNTLSMSNYG